jgi:phosphatidylglycerophosphatase A
VIARAVLSFLGLGFLPGPSGTYASAATALLLWGLHGPAAGPASAGVLVCFAAASLATVALAGRTAHGAHGDPGWVVTDEVAGQALAVGLGGAVARGSGLLAFAAAFVLFRALDIAKPGPVGAAERLPGGWGVWADDVLAGAAAGGAVAVLRALGALGA